MTIYSFDIKSRRIGTLDFPSSAIGPADPSFEFTQLIVPGMSSGGDGSEVVVDGSSAQRPIESFGAAQIDLAQTPFPGTKTLLCDGGGDYVSFPSFTLLRTEPWTVDAFVRVPSGAGTNFRLRQESGGILSYLTAGGAGVNAVIGSNQLGNSSDVVSGTLVADQWEFFAIVNQPGVGLQMWRNTDRILNNASAYDWPIELVGRYVAIGPANYDFIGNLYVRVTAGVARYDGPTLAVPTAHFPEN